MGIQIQWSKTKRRCGSKSPSQIDSWRMNESVSKDHKIGFMYI